jgi:hypothetical protein
MLNGYYWANVKEDGNFGPPEIVQLWGDKVTTMGSNIRLPLHAVQIQSLINEISADGGIVLPTDVAEAVIETAMEDEISKLAFLIKDQLIDDLKRRKGFRDVYDDLDGQTRVELSDTWTNLVSILLRHSITVEGEQDDPQGDLPAT